MSRSLVLRSASGSEANPVATMRWGSVIAGWRRSSGGARRCPGQELFQYLDDAGESHDITSDDVNAYLRDTAHADVTASDFRTWAGDGARISSA